MKNTRQTRHSANNPAPPHLRRQATTRAARAVSHDLATREPADVETAPVELSAKVKRAIETLRAPFKAFTADLAALTVSRAQLAPAFMKAFETFKTETELGLADFTRQFDPTVPADRDGYRQHKAYQAADYLRRIVAQSARPQRADRPQAATPLDGMARLIASMLPLLSADQVPRLWESVERELHWSDRQVSALQHRVDAAEALVNVRPPRGQAGQVPQLRIAASRSTSEDDAVAPRTGTHG